MVAGARPDFKDGLARPNLRPVSINFLDEDVRDKMNGSRWGVLRMDLDRSHSQPEYSLFAPRRIVVHERDPLGRVTFFFNGQPIDPICCKQRKPLLEAPLVQEPGFAVEEFLSLTAAQ